MFFQLEPKIQAALIAGIVAIAVALIPVIFSYRKNKLEILKIEAELGQLKSEKAERASRALKPLVELERILSLNEKIFDSLIGQRGELEYHPVILRNLFRQLQQSDPKKIFWYESIKELQENNRAAIMNIREYSGDVLTERFRSACVDFEFHVSRWEQVWKAVEMEASGPADDVASSLGEQFELDTTKCFLTDPNTNSKVKNSLYAERFPEDMRPALANEMKERKELLREFA